MNECPPICPTPSPSRLIGLRLDETQVIGQWVGEVFIFLIVILLILILLVVTGLTIWVTKP